MRRPTLFVNLFLPKWFSCIQSVIHFPSQEQAAIKYTVETLFFSVYPPLQPPPPSPFKPPSPQKHSYVLYPCCSGLDPGPRLGQAYVRPSRVKWVWGIELKCPRNPCDQHLARTNRVKNRSATCNSTLTLISSPPCHIEIEIPPLTNCRHTRSLLLSS